MTPLATQFLSQTTILFALLGMATGALYGLVALGVVLTYRASGVLNFAASALGAISAFFFFWLRDDKDVPWGIALILALALGALIGAMTQLVIMEALRKVSLLGKLIAALGLMALAQGVITIVFKPGGLVLPQSLLPTNPIHITDQLVLPAERLILIGAVIVVALILSIFYTRTTFGLATSAVAESRRVASSSGWSPSRIELFNFTLAGVLNAGAVILLAPIVGLFVSVLTLVILPALAAALVGRFSSFAITVAAALGIGVISSELTLFRADIASIFGWQETTLNGLPDVVPLVIIVLMTAISGRARLQRGESLTRLPLPGDGRISPPLLAIGVAISTGLLLVVDPSWADAFVTTFSVAILVLSVVVVSGYAGQLSLCQYALAGFGAWVAARLVATQGWPFELALPVGMLATIPLGLIVALPALRTRGVNLAVATLALALMIYAIVFNNGPLTGGFAGTVVPPPDLFGLSLDPISYPGRYGIFVLALLVLAGICVANVRRGRAGRRLLAVRANERAAASLGIGVYGAKLYAFALSSAIAGLAGIVIGFRTPNIQFTTFDVFGSINAVLYAVVGGIGWASGSIIGALNAPGAIPAKLVNDLLGGVGNLYAWLLIVAGLAVVATLRAAPDGLAAMQSRHFRAVTARIYTRPPRIDPPPQPRPTRTPAKLEVEAATVRFGGVVAVDNVSFTVSPGEIVGLIGPNGAGKTTLIDMITGFTRQASGSVRIDGENIDSWSPERRARSGVGRSWQAVELFEEMTVRENLLVAADEKRSLRYLTDIFWPGRTAPTESMAEIVAEFDLAAHLDERPSSLSQGTARLVGIGRAVVTEPSVLLLDEPAAGLDLQESTELGVAIRAAVRRSGIGVLIVEHDVNLLLSICDRIVVIDFGRKIAEGTPTEIANDPVVIQAYLGEATDEDGGHDVPAVQPTEPDPTLPVARATYGDQRGPAGGEPGVTVLETRGLKAGYGQTTIVHSLDLEVRAGEVVALLGPNGAGKSTTILTLAGELPALGGEVLLHGDPTSAPLYQRVRQGLGLVSEERTVLMRMTVAENLRVNGGDSEFALELFPELVPHLKRRVAMLSGGQQQMLALARALSRRPSVLLADELSLGLAPIIVNRLLDVVRTAADGGIGVLLVEQHIHKALTIADRVYVLGRGRIQLSGSGSELRERVDEVQESYLSANLTAGEEAD